MFTLTLKAVGMGELLMIDKRDLGHAARRSVVQTKHRTLVQFRLRKCFPCLDQVYDVAARPAGRRQARRLVISMDPANA